MSCESILNKIINTDFESFQRWSEGSKISGPSAVLKKKIRELLNIISGYEITVMLGDILTIKEIESLKNPYKKVNKLRINVSCIKLNY